MWLLKNGCQPLAADAVAGYYCPVEDGVYGGDLKARDEGVLADGDGGGDWCRLMWLKISDFGSQLKLKE
jgi:hypothetical protein